MSHSNDPWKRLNIEPHRPKRDGFWAKVFVVLAFIGAGAALGLVAGFYLAWRAMATHRGTFIMLCFVLGAMFGAIGGLRFTLESFREMKRADQRKKSSLR